MPTPSKYLQEHFSDWLRAARAAKGLSLRGFARGVISPSGIRALEDSAHDPRLTTFVNCCYAVDEDPCKVLASLLAKGIK